MEIHRYEIHTENETIDGYTTKGTFCYDAEEAESKVLETCKNLRETMVEILKKDGNGEVKEEDFKNTDQKIDGNGCYNGYENLIIKKYSNNCGDEVEFFYMYRKILGEAPCVFCNIRHTKSNGGDERRLKRRLCVKLIERDMGEMSGWTSN